MSKHAELQALKQEIMNSLHVALPGEVVAYYTETGTADIQPSIKTRNGVQYPILRDVPVFYWGRYNFTPQEGDGCLVVFSDLCVDDWIENGGVSDNPSDRKHDISDGFAFVGFRVSNRRPIDGGDIEVVSRQANGLAPQLPDEDNTTKYLKGDGTWANAVDSTKLPLAGGTMTGNLTMNGGQIAYKGSRATYNMIKFIDNTGDEYGNGISIGGGGLVVIGAGESSDAISSGKSGGEESLFLGADGGVYILTNVQDGLSSAKTFTFDINGYLTAVKFIGSLQGTADAATKLATAGTTAQFYRGDRIWSNELANYRFLTTDIPEQAVNFNTAATAHKITFYRNGFTIPYQMDNTNDGGLLRVRGMSESETILELATWDDSGSGETIQFNYYPTTSEVTPTHSVSVPKASGTIALTGSSSKKVKENIKPMSEEEARKLLKIRLVSFDYKKGFGKKNQFGAIAEEVEKIIPMPVIIPENYKESEFREERGFNQPIPQIDYAKFMPYAIKMIQIQQKEIDDLKRDVELLKQLVNELKS